MKKTVHEVKLILTEEEGAVHLDVTTPATLSTIEVVGLLEMAKKQFIDSKHTLQGVVYSQEPTDG